SVPVPHSADTFCVCRSSYPSCHCCTPSRPRLPFFFFNDTAPTEIYTLSLHDALPIYFKVDGRDIFVPMATEEPSVIAAASNAARDRKSTRLNSSHVKISYAVFCLKKKKQKQK